MGGQFGAQSPGAEAGSQSRAGGELACIEPNRGNEALLVPDCGSQVEYEVTNALQGVIDEGNRFPQFSRQAANLALLQVEFNDLGVELEHDEVVADLVVKILGQLAPLLFVGVTHFDQQIL